MNIRAEIFGGRQAEEKLLKEKQPKKTDSTSLVDVSIPREETRRSNDRDQDRYRLNGQLFRVTCDGQDHDAEVVNLSGGGAMIAAGLQPNIGECVHLHLGEGGSIECAVRWVKGGRLGLEFAHETQLDCSENERSAVLRDVIRRAFPDEKFAARVPAEPAEQQPQYEEQRAARRHPLIWSGELHYGTNSWNVRLRNISATGALVQCPGGLRVDSEVVLDLHKAGTIFASVSWVVGDHIGLKFDQPFDLRRLAECNPTVTPPAWQRPEYLQGDGQSDSPWDEAWSRLSVDDLKTQLEGFLKH